MGVFQKVQRSLEVLSTGTLLGSEWREECEGRGGQYRLEERPHALLSFFLGYNFELIRNVVHPGALFRIMLVFSGRVVLVVLWDLAPLIIS